MVGRQEAQSLLHPLLLHQAPLARPAPSPGSDACPHHHTVVLHGLSGLPALSPGMCTVKYTRNPDITQTSKQPTHTRRPIMCLSFFTFDFFSKLNKNSLRIFICFLLLLYCQILSVLNTISISGWISKSVFGYVLCMAPYVHADSFRSIIIVIGPIILILIFQYLYHKKKKNDAL